MSGEKRKTVKLHFDPSRPVHLGGVGIGVEQIEPFLRSDTLFSAICTIWPELYGEDGELGLKGMLNGFTNNKPPFLVSSGYPFTGNKRYCLPKPFLPVPKSESTPEYDDLALELKKADFIPADIFSLWIQGQSLEGKGGAIEGGRSDLKNKIVETAISRNALDRLSHASEIYYCGAMIFKDDSGFCFMIEFREEKWEKPLEAVLRLLGERGLGGERHLGYGRFEPEWAEDGPVFSSAEESEPCCSLSLYHPAESELDGLSDRLVGYELIQRGGWIGSPLADKGYRRKLCRMFVEGSAFKKPPVGRLVPVKPEGAKIPHEVYRYGYAFTIPVRIEE